MTAEATEATIEQVTCSDEEDIYILKLRKRRDGKSLTTHHIEPTSRDGDDTKENLTIWHRKFHEAWHHMFINMTVEEIHRFIDVMNIPDKIRTKKDIRDIRNTIINGTFQEVS